MGYIDQKLPLEYGPLLSAQPPLIINWQIPYMVERLWTVMVIDDGLV